MTALAQYSDWLYGATGGVLVLALVFLLVEQAWGRHAVAASDGRRREARELLAVGGGSGTVTVPAGGDGGVVTDPAGLGDDTPAEDTVERPDEDTGPATGTGGSSPDRAERAGRMGLSLVILAAALLGGALVLRGLATGRAPWGNMYEYIATVCEVALITWLVVVRRYPVRHLTGFVLLPITILLFIGGTKLYVPAGPVVPALRSYWLVIHVLAAIVGSGILLVPGVASVLYLVRRSYEDGSTRFSGFAARLPRSAMLDRIAYRTTILAFPIFTFGVICGAIWAEAAWGRYWGWDPKETVAFIMWVVYAAYLHSRATAGWRASRAAVINVVGFAMCVFNLFFINLVVTGLHSYAGVG